jgi:hypothetical protein
MEINMFDEFETYENRPLTYGEFEMALDGPRNSLFKSLYDAALATAVRLVGLAKDAVFVQPLNSPSGE